MTITDFYGRAKIPTTVKHEGSMNQKEAESMEHDQIPEASKMFEAMQANSELFKLRRKLALAEWLLGSVRYFDLRFDDTIVLFTWQSREKESDPDNLGYAIHRHHRRSEKPMEWLLESDGSRHTEPTPLAALEAAIEAGLIDDPVEDGKA